MEIGYSIMDITPPLGVELGGYGYFLERKAEGILDSLYARAVAFIDEGKKFLLVNCDLIHLTKNSVDVVKHQLHNEFGISEESIMLLCIHNHTSPATGGTLGCGESDEKYVEILHELLVNVGKAAFKNLRKVVSAKQFVMPIAPIGYNRVDQHRPIDHRLHGMTFSFEEGKPLALVSYGCHPVTLGISTYISADYPGRVVNALADKGYDGIYLNGLCGDVDPVSNIYKWGAGSSETIDAYGQQIADAFTEGIGKAKVMKHIVLETFGIPIEFKLQHYGEKEIDNLLEHYRSDKENNPVMYKVVKLWASEMKSRIANGDETFLEMMNVQVFRIGDVILAGFPAEVFSILGMIVKEALPNFNIMTLGCANDILRYIAIKEDILNSGYAGFVSNFLYRKLPLTPGEGERMAECVANTLREKYYEN